VKGRGSPVYGVSIFEGLHTIKALDKKDPRRLPEWVWFVKALRADDEGRVGIVFLSEMSLLTSVVDKQKPPRRVGVEKTSKYARTPSGINSGGD